MKITLSEESMSFHRGMPGINEYEGYCTLLRVIQIVQYQFFPCLIQISKQKLSTKHWQQVKQSPIFITYKQKDYLIQSLASPFIRKHCFEDSRLVLQVMIEGSLTKMMNPMHTISMRITTHIGSKQQHLEKEKIGSVSKYPGSLVEWNVCGNSGGISGGILLPIIAFYYQWPARSRHAQFCVGPSSVL